MGTVTHHVYETIENMIKIGVCTEERSVTFTVFVRNNNTRFQKIRCSYLEVTNNLPMRYQTGRDVAKHAMAITRHVQPSNMPLHKMLMH